MERITNRQLSRSFNVGVWLHLTHVVVHTSSLAMAGVRELTTESHSLFLLLFVVLSLGVSSMWLHCAPLLLHFWCERRLSEEENQRGKKAKRLVNHPPSTHPWHTILNHSVRFDPPSPPPQLQWSTSCCLLLLNQRLSLPVRVRVVWCGLQR